MKVIYEVGDPVYIPHENNGYRLWYVCEIHERWVKVRNAVLGERALFHTELGHTVTGIPSDTGCDS